MMGCGGQAGAESELSDKLLELRGVSKSYGATHVLENVSLGIEAGEVVVIVGFSGAGKSTLISLLAGLDRPDAGQVLFKGAVAPEAGPQRMLVFQNYSLLPWLTAFGNVALAVDEVFSSWPAEKRQAHTERFIGMVGLEHAKDRKPAQLSGGMRQRVALARALATDPEVLLLDEPLSALDALTRANLQDALERIVRTSGKTIVLVTNDVDEAILLADRIVPLSAGPRATLGPEFPITIARPRDRRALNHDPEFRRVRTAVIEYLLSTKHAPRPAAPERPTALAGAPAEVTP
jgi:nitrate/nitrite transport system ATP-binding protein